MLYACCLENSPDVAADESFATLEQVYFDWNEVRVTTTAELMESMKNLQDSESAATQLKKVLHGVFETYYKFDIDFLRKENLRKTVQQFSKFRGVSPFVVSYTAQVALGGHFIPLDDAMMQLFFVLGLIDDNEVSKYKVSGLERAIPKSKGIEFFSVVHQLATAFYKSPHNVDLRKTLNSISADASDRFPKRGARKKAEAELPQPVEPVERANKSGRPKKDPSLPPKKKTAAGQEKSSLKNQGPAKSKNRSSISKKATPSGKKTSAGSLSRRKPR
jgi:endonuclease-3